LRSAGWKGKSEPMEKIDIQKKKQWKPGNVLYPAPPVLVSCGGAAGWKDNLITIAWAGNVCSDPPMLSISVRPERHSYAMIQATGEFVVNVPTVKLAWAVDWCGVISGREQDKFAGAGLTKGKALKLRAPIVAECPINIECLVKKSVELGSHTLFIAEVVAVQVTDALIDGRGKFAIEKSGLLAFAHGQYFVLGRRLGGFGFSVRKVNRKSRSRSPGKKHGNDALSDNQRGD